ncbi:MAG: proton-conducting transporter membrane subunit [Candidatus Omnitrophica bacterium]|nr:proton-conducting transporter membrane subunit [Candidatus Omnitrophota bacterium]
MTPQALVPYMIFVPLAAAFLIPPFGKKFKRAGDAIPCAASVCVTTLGLYLASSVALSKVLVHKPYGWQAPFGTAFVVDGLSGIFLVAMNIVALVVAVYSIGYLNTYTDRWKFSSLFMLMLAGINGVLISGDIFTLYVFLEIAAISGYFLVAFGIAPDGLEAAFKYAVMGALASVFVLLGIALIYAHTSTLSIAGIASVISVGQQTDVLKFATVLLLVAFSIKAALVPFHAWLPYAYSSAPAPISAMLAGVSTKVLGIYTIMRIFFVMFEMTPQVSMVLIALGVASMVVASILAFVQVDIKRLFAYSSISQIGYVALGLGVGTPLAVFGALFHLLNHSAFKPLLFLASGAITRLTGTRNLGKIRGVMKDSPVTGTATLVGSLSICGIPPLGGFWSKLIIILACIQAGRPVLALVAVVVSVLTLAYYFRSITQVIFGKSVIRGQREGAVTVSMAIAMVTLVIISASMAILLLPNTGNAVLKEAVSVILNGKSYSAMVAGVLK